MCTKCTASLASSVLVSFNQNSSFLQMYRLFRGIKRPSGGLFLTKVDFSWLSATFSVQRKLALPQRRQLFQARGPVFLCHRRLFPLLLDQRLISPATTFLRRRFYLCHTDFISARTFFGQMSTFEGDQFNKSRPTDGDISRLSGDFFRHNVKFCFCCFIHLVCFIRL